jgi:hypothetical protein
VSPSLIGRPVRVALVVLLLAAVGAGIWLWGRAGSSTPVSEESALEAYRAAGGAAAASPGVPRSGVYAFRQEGSERAGAGPVGVSRDLPDVARYLVTPAAGGYREEIDLSKEHIEAVVLRVGKGGTREVSRRTKVTFLGFGRDDRRDLRPPPLRMTARLAAGRTWSGSYVAGSLPVEFRSEVQRADAVELDGRRYRVWVIRTVADTGGVHPGRRIDVIWWSPRLALPLRWSIDMEIGGPATLETHSELTLESAVPKV